MSREQFRKARELIKQERFGEACALLRALEDPIAQHWLKQLAAIEAYFGKPLPKADAGTPARASNRTGFITAAVVMALVLVVGGVVLLRGSGGTNLIGAQPTATITPGGPTLTPSPTPAPSATPTPYPCDAALWWGEVRAYVEPFLQFAVLPQADGINLMGYGTMAINEVIANQSRLTNAPYPDCAEVTALRDTILEAQTRVITSFTHPLSAVANIDQFITYSVEDVRLYAAQVMDALDGLTGIGDRLAAAGLPFSESATLTTYRTNNTASCPKVRWMFEQYTTLGSAFGRFTPLFENPDYNMARDVLNDMRRELRRLQESGRPDCVSRQYDLLLDTYRSLAGLLQNLVDSQSQFATALSANEVLAAFVQMDASMRALDAIGILEGVDFFGG